MARKKVKKPAASALFSVVLMDARTGEERARQAEAGTHHAKGEASRKCDAVGIEAITELILGGVPQRLIAQQVGVSPGALWLWMNEDSERRQACARARRDAAQAFDEMAEQVLLTADGTPPEIQRAAQLAQHYRWRAKVVNPKVYGDKIEVEHKAATLADALRALDAPAAMSNDGRAEP